MNATTIIKDRPDGGNGSPDPYWADDYFTRHLTISLTGGTPGAYTYTAAIDDTAGTFVAIKEKQTPNQGAPYTGDVIQSAVTGTMNGYADYSFTASSLPSTAPGYGVPAFENDGGNPPVNSTSAWYELAFPHGTVFGGAGIGAWSWTYGANVALRVFPFVSHQQWVDAWDNGYGDLPGDGNITG